PPPLSGVPALPCDIFELGQDDAIAVRRLRQLEGRQVGKMSASPMHEERRLFANELSQSCFKPTNAVLRLCHDKLSSRCECFTYMKARIETTMAAFRTVTTGRIRWSGWPLSAHAFDTASASSFPSRRPRRG